MRYISIAENAKFNGIAMTIGALFGGSMMLWFDWNVITPINQFKNDELTTVGFSVVVIALLILSMVVIIKLRK